MKHFNLMFVEIDSIDVESIDSHGYIDMLLEAVKQINRCNIFTTFQK